MPFRFAVIADSHFHPVKGPAQRTYPSDLLHNGRNENVVALLQRVAPDFVVHLGDVPHPVPGSPGHEESLSIAKRLYGSLGCPFHVVAGNHDVGDKPQPWTPAPRTSDAFHDVFRVAWGEPWGAFSWKGCRFLRIDTPLLGTRTKVEDEQWAWLERELRGLRATGERLFVLTHYPPFLHEPDEPAHYDNLDPGPRTRLLDVLRPFEPEAVFSGHVHHFFWNTLDRTDFWILPATSFVRPEYSELDKVAPVAENGRDDDAKLGFLIVHVGDARGAYDVEHVRGLVDPSPAPVQALEVGTGAPPHLGLGVTLRHDWNESLVVPCGNLDELTRKRARNDLGLLAAWDIGASPLRVPLSDLRVAAERMRGVARRGTRFWIFSLGAPSDYEQALVHENADILEGWELVLPLGTELPTWTAQSPVPIFRSVIGRPRAKTGPHSHFHAHGFELDDDPGAEAGAVFRIPGDTSPWAGIARASSWSEARGRPAMALVELPRAGEAATFENDDAVAGRLAEAFVAARAFPGVRGLVDGLIDHDRGYFPRHGIVDRRGAPRAAYRVLRKLGRIAPPGTLIRSLGGGRFQIAEAGVLDLQTLQLERSDSEPIAL
jgi:hypothetical protein